MADVLDIDAFLDRRRDWPVLDVRTPAEFARGHVPGAYNLPLFSDAERAEIGTLYKQRGRRVALLRGLDLAGPRLRAMVEQAAAWMEGPDVLVHCWRGGMRSASVAWLLDFSGYRPATLQGGYKAFRRAMHDDLETPRDVLLLGGMTGARKTEVLHALAQCGEQVIDLEALAGHRGSVFGHLGQPPQPTQEQFENDLGLRWRSLDPAWPVWIEDESRRLGQVLVPAGVWERMQEAPVLILDVPFDERLAHLVEGYGRYEPDRLVEAVGVIRKRLGGLHAKQAAEAIGRGDLYAACRLLLAYYDRAYAHHLDRRGDVERIPIPAQPGASPDALAAAAQATAQTAVDGAI